MIPIHEAQNQCDLTVYIAGKWEARERLQAIAQELRVHGYRVTSSWLDHPLAQGYLVDNGVDEGVKDLDEIDASNVFVLDTLDEGATGGREVELGYALAEGSNRLLIIVGPSRNIFHSMVAIQFGSWDDVLPVFFSPRLMEERR